MTLKAICLPLGRQILIVFRGADQDIPISTISIGLLLLLRVSLLCPKLASGDEDLFESPDSCILAQRLFDAAGNTTRLEISLSSFIAYDRCSLAAKFSVKHDHVACDNSCIRLHCFSIKHRDIGIRANAKMTFLRRPKALAPFTLALTTKSRMDKAPKRTNGNPFSTMTLRG